jgi:hypothetical protein
MESVMEHLDRECLKADFPLLCAASGGSLLFSLAVIFALVGFPL